MRGRKPKPKHLKLLGGETRPSRVNYNEPEGDCDHIQPTQVLDEDQLLVWHTLIPDLVRSRILQNTDCAALTRLYIVQSDFQQVQADYERAGPIGKGSQG